LQTSIVWRIRLVLTVFAMFSTKTLILATFLKYLVQTIPFLHHRTCLYDGHRLTCRLRICHPNAQSHNYVKFNGNRRLLEFHILFCAIGCFRVALIRIASQSDRLGSEHDVPMNSCCVSLLRERIVKQAKPDWRPTA